MPLEYVEERDGGYYFTSSRVSLDSIVYQFLQGESPEAIIQAFPSLSLEQVYGGITLYLAHRAEINACLKQGEAFFEELARASREANDSCTRSWELRDEPLALLFRSSASTTRVNVR